MLAAAGPAPIVTDVASTKRALAGIDDPRFVPGHPDRRRRNRRPGARGGRPVRRSDVVPHSDAASAPESVALVERFVSSLGARPVHTEAGAHDRMLALTSHLPHAIANALMLAAAQDETALAHAGASFREMTRVAGANPPLWTDILLENRDELDAALAAFRASSTPLPSRAATSSRSRSPPPPRRASGSSRSPTRPSRRS